MSPLRYLSLPSRLVLMRCLPPFCSRQRCVPYLENFSVAVVWIFYGVLGSRNRDPTRRPSMENRERLASNFIVLRRPKYVVNTRRLAASRIDHVYRFRRRFSKRSDFFFCDGDFVRYVPTCAETRRWNCPWRGLKIIWWIFYEFRRLVFLFVSKMWNTTRREFKAEGRIKNVGRIFIRNERKKNRIYEPNFWSAAALTSILQREFLPMLSRLWREFYEIIKPSTYSYYIECLDTWKQRFFDEEILRSFLIWPSPSCNTSYFYSPGKRRCFFGGIYGI